MRGTSPTSVTASAFERSLAALGMTLLLPSRRCAHSFTRTPSHKYRALPKEKVRDVIEIVKRLLRSLGYLKPDGLMDVARQGAGRAKIRLARMQEARAG